VQTTCRVDSFLLKLPPNGLFGKAFRLPSQHGRELLVALSNLFAHGYQAFCNVAVLFSQEQVRQLYEIDLLER
jgi:hypothetical protein